MKKLIFLFPGQGAQQVGMAKDLYASYHFVRELFDMAEEITKLPLKKLCFEGPMEELTQTIHLQPALTTTSLSFLRALQQAHSVIPVASAGHSLGEYSALAASGVLTEENTLRAVFERGRLMHQEASAHPGSMAAIIGLTISEVENIIQEIASSAEIVSVANHNLENQIVITGTTEAVLKVSEIASQKEARVVPLKVSGAWHSELIRGATTPFSSFLETLPFSAPITPLYFNVTAESEKNPEKILTLMVQQLCSPVRWFDIMQNLLNLNADIMVELGPGKVLSGLFGKICPADSSQTAVSINSLEKLEQFLEETLK